MQCWLAQTRIIESLMDRPNEILRVSLKQLWTLLRIRGKLYSYFDSTDKKEITFILTLALIKGKVASWVGGDEPINDSEKRRMPRNTVKLWSSPALIVGAFVLVWVMLLSQSREDPVHGPHICRYPVRRGRWDTACSKASWHPAVKPAFWPMYF